MRVTYARVAGPLAFSLVAIAGLLVVKWWPYGTRLAAQNVAFGASLLDAAPLDYAARYVGSVWPAMVLGVVLAAATESLLPRSWLVGLLGRASLRSSTLGGLVALPAMMCSCCAAPIAAGMRRSGVAPGAALAFWLGSPTLNPAVIAFLLLALPWQFAAIRLAAGVTLVFGVCYVAARLVPDARVPVPASADAGAARAGFFPALARYVVTLVPEWLVLALVLGFARAWLLPSLPALPPNAPGALAAAAVGGTLFMIPTAGEIPIAQALLALGFGAGPVAALLVTLPAVSLPSLAMVWSAFPRRMLLATAGLVALIGLVSGVVASRLPL